MAKLTIEKEDVTVTLIQIYITTGEANSNVVSFPVADISKGSKLWYNYLVPKFSTCSVGGIYKRSEGCTIYMFKIIYEANFNML